MKILQNSLKWQSRTAKQAKGHLLLKFACVCVRERDSLKISFMCKCSCLYLFVHGRICAWGTEQCSSACWVIRWHSGLERKRHIHMNTHTHTQINMQKYDWTSHCCIWTLSLKCLSLTYTFILVLLWENSWTWCNPWRLTLSEYSFFLFAHTYNTVTSFKYEWIR